MHYMGLINDEKCRRNGGLVTQRMFRKQTCLEVTRSVYEG